MINRTDIYLSIAYLIGLTFACTLLVGIGVASLSSVLGFSILESKSTLMYSMLWSSIGIFLLPLSFHPKGRQLLRQATPRRLYREMREIFCSPFSLLLLFAVAGGMVAASTSLSFVSEWLIGILPSSWGIDIEDTVSQQIKELLQSGWDSRLLEFVVICLTPALVEELFFRGTMQSLFIAADRHRPLLAIGVTSVIFSLVHLSLVGFLSRLTIGFVLGYSYHYTSRIGIPILLHLINNFVAWQLLIYSA